MNKKSIITTNKELAERYAAGDEELERAQWIAEAKKLGEDHGRAAATWTINGNNDVSERANVLQMMRDGDPAVDDYLPQLPVLSGEYTDGLTPKKLFEDITGRDSHADASYNGDAYGQLVEELCDAYDEGVSDVFTSACETELIKFCE